MFALAMGAHALRKFQRFHVPKGGKSAGLERARRGGAAGAGRGAGGLGAGGCDSHEPRMADEILFLKPIWFTICWGDAETGQQSSSLLVENRPQRLWGKATLVAVPANHGADVGIGE